MSLSAIDNGLLKKVQRNLAKNKGGSTERKYLGKTDESSSCVLIGTGSGLTNPPVVQYPDATLLILGCCSNSDRSIWMWGSFLLQGKHPHHPQSSSVVIWPFYIPTELGNLPGDAENRAISKASTMSSSGDWGVAGALQRFWLLAPIEMDLPLGWGFLKLWKSPTISENSGCLHSRCCSKLSHMHPGSQPQRDDFKWQ